MTKNPAIALVNPPPASVTRSIIASATISATTSAIRPCPCGSQQPYQQCCQPLISGQHPAATAERLMRSRYSAFVMAEADYLLATSHPDHRQGLERQSLIDPQIRWLQLQVIASQQGGTMDNNGQVHFIATFVEAGQFGTLEEHSRFSRIDQCWYYRDGDTRIKTFTPERNAPCPCGSGIKFKRCCRRQ